MSPLLDIRSLSVTFRGEQAVRAVEDVSFSLAEGEVAALVGESGCGKSVVAHAVAGLLPPGAAVSGAVLFQGRDLLALAEREMEAVRGAGIGVVFQNPSLALNPLHTVGRQVAEPLRVHRGEKKEQAFAAACRALAALGFADAPGLMRLYPSQCSGGMNQRVVTAASTILDPPLLIADEPTKGLDRDRVADVAGELGRLVAERGTALLLITHDIPVALALADRVAVMYAGEIVETGPAREVLGDPAHPYTRGLVASLPENGFVPIPGASPSPVDPPAGCRFHPRCSFCVDRCRTERPALAAAGRRLVRCRRCP
ncbi:MAG: peptide/nickel transport system ATP-binding protein [Methanofollis sp.]|nr:peptide/nickel transport system ATP-binding protein [Methanofollis sp.]